MTKRLTEVVELASPNPPIEYTLLPGEREFFVALCGGEEDYRAWCFDIMYGPGMVGPLDDLLKP